MGRTKAIHAKGTLFQIEDTPGVYYTIAELTTISIPEPTVDKIEATNHDSEDFFREYIPGLIDGGTINLAGNYIPGDTTQKKLIADLFNRGVKNCRLVLPDAINVDNRSRWEFPAFVGKFGGQAPANNKLDFTASIEIAGKPEFVSTYSNNLSNLVVTTATLAPAFSASTYEYIATVDNATESVTVTPTASQGVITVNGATVTSGQASAAIPLNVGLNTILVRVKEADKGAREYRVVIGRAAA